MRLIHFSDTHLGFQAYDVVNDAGVNAREQDVYDAFSRVIDRMLALRPDAVIHSGDFFHRPSPSNRALTIALEQLRRLSDAAIPLYLIAGNHETPKSHMTSPILRALRSLEHVYPAYAESPEFFEIGTQVALHALPHINDARLLREALEALRPLEGRCNILMMHTSFGKKYLMEEYGEQIFPPEFESKLLGFQYIALGHWHNFQQTGGHPNAWYSGSTERLSDTEASAEKGFIVLELDDHGQLSLQFETVATRPWLKLDIPHCADKSSGAIRAELEFFRDQHDCTDAIISLNFNDIRPEQTLDLSNLRLREIFPDAFQLLPRRKIFQEQGAFAGLEARQFDSLDTIFADYVQRKYPDDTIGARIADKARHYFNRFA